MSEENEKLTKVIHCGNHIETVSSNVITKERKAKIYRLDKEHYVDGKTGEVREFKEPPQYKAVYQVTKELNTARYRIYLNVIGNENRCLFVTLTYNSNVIEKKLQTDLHNFHTNVNKSIGHHEYIDFLQLGNNHYYHCHSILIFDNDVNNINWQVVDCWKNKGSVDVKKVFDTLGIIKYLSSLNGNNCGLDSDISNKINIWNYHPDDYKDYSQEKQSLIKSYVRNQRMKYYSPYFRTVRYSKGIRKEQIDYCDDYELSWLIGDSKPDFEKEIKVKNTGVINTYRHYDFA